MDDIVENLKKALANVDQEAAKQFRDSLPELPEDGNIAISIPQKPVAPSANEQS